MGEKSSTYIAPLKLLNTFDHPINEIVLRYVNYCFLHNYVFNIVVTIGPTNSTSLCSPSFNAIQRQSTLFKRLAKDGQQGKLNVVEQCWMEILDPLFEA